MARYKWEDEARTSVQDKETGARYIKPGTGAWAEFLKWIGSGGEADSYKTDEELLEDSKKVAGTTIRTSYSQACYEPVTALKGEFNGGLSSSMAIFNAAQLAEYLGEDTVSVTDINNEEISCSIDEARAIASEIGVAYRRLFYKKQRLMVAIDAATSVSEIETISWEGN